MVYIAKVEKQTVVAQKLCKLMYCFINTLVEQGAIGI